MAVSVSASGTVSANMIDSWSIGRDENGALSARVRWHFTDALGEARHVKTDYVLSQAEKDDILDGTGNVGLVAGALAAMAAALGL